MSNHEPAPHRYAIVRELGRGGMATTYVAHRLDCVEAPLVCLKRLRPELAADPVQRGHFIDEGRVLARLCHPNVVAVLDAGTDEYGDYLVTELVDGVDLRRLIAWMARRGQAMPERIALRVAKEVADALAHAHAHGVIHRDVTPANVLLGRDGRVVLIDFGVARSDAQTQRTRTGLIKGKVAYMAPEQALGHPIDARIDLFALGVVLYEMLEGVRPHDGPSDVDTVTNAMRGLRRPMTTNLASRGLESLLASLLAASADARPSDAEVVASDLAAMGPADPGELARLVRAAGDGDAPNAERGPGAEPYQRWSCRPSNAPDDERSSEPDTQREEAIATKIVPALPQNSQLRAPEEAIATKIVPAVACGSEPTKRDGGTVATAVIRPPLYISDSIPSAPDGRARARETDVRNVAVDDGPTTMEPPAIAVGDATLLTPKFQVTGTRARPRAPRPWAIVLQAAAVLALGLVAGVATGGLAAWAFRAWWGG